MPAIHVQLFAGRSIDTKRTLAQALTDAAVGVLGCSPGAVDVIFTDIQKHDWATGGRLWSDGDAPAPAPSPTPRPPTP